MHHRAAAVGRDGAAGGGRGRAWPYLNGVAVADLPGPVQAQCLRGLARAESAQTAAQARMLGALSASSAYEDDGQGSARMWLRWQTQITNGAADGAIGWMKRLAAHPALAATLAGGSISPSWARTIAAWTDLLPQEHRASADEILLAAAAGGASLADLAGLAEEIRGRTATPDNGPDPGGDEDGFAHRRAAEPDLPRRGPPGGGTDPSVRGGTIGGAGVLRQEGWGRKLHGPRCSATTTPSKRPAAG